MLTEPWRIIGGTKVLFGELAANESRSSNRGLQKLQCLVRLNIDTRFETISVMYVARKSNPGA